MEFFEQLVLEHLMKHEKLFTRYDWKVKRDESGAAWYAQVDILALDVPNNRLYFIEVTSNRSLQKYLSNKLAEGSRKTIESFAYREMDLSGLTLTNHWRIYVRRELVNKTKELPIVADLVSAGSCQVLALEDVLEARLPN